MRNRGYKYIIKQNSLGYLFLCINATWINHMLRERGINPSDFRKLTYEDIAAVQTDNRKKSLFTRLKPKSFWEMSDTLALFYAEYDLSSESVNESKDKKNNIKLHEEEWFIKHPVFTQEDIYELLLEKGMEQEDALRVMEVVRRGRCCTLKLSHDEFMQLYDVPEEVYSVIKKCKYVPPREKVIQSLLDSIERAVYIKKLSETDSKYKNKESI